MDFTVYKEDIIAFRSFDTASSEETLSVTS